MEIIGLIWLGTRTDRADQLNAFYREVLGLSGDRVSDTQTNYDLPDGSTVEVFGPGDAGHKHFDTGPVAGFRVRDIAAAVGELQAAGVELLGGLDGEAGNRWQHFRAPDGLVYELTERPDPA
jgi:catechol 2,3-dioxygenase-like lactoylglutathione lyase family enzyme